MLTSTRTFLLLAAAVAPIATTGCASMIDRTLGSAGDAAGQRIGTSIGNSAGDAIAPAAGSATAAAMGGQYMTIYTSYIFGLAFSSGGYAISTRDYQPGEYTRFSLPASDGTQNTIERARLFDDANGNQWWKVKYTEGKKGEVIILEGLLSPKDQRMVRLRGKFPKDEAAKEMPVDEQSYYVPPRRLSRESIEGATVGTETVTTPAGTFKGARHVVFGDAGGNSHEWWLDDKVPGGAVRQALKSTSRQAGNGPDAGNYVMSLVAYGSDAKSDLGTR